MHKQQPSPRKSVQRGVILLEAMIAILIFSFAVLGIIGLQAAMVKNTADSKYRADAGYIAQQKIGQIWADPDPTRTGYADLSEDAVDISSLLPGGTRTTVLSTPVIVNATASTQYSYTYTATVTVKWQEPGQAQHNFTTKASISGS